jgi:cytochrome c5
MLKDGVHMSLRAPALNVLMMLVLLVVLVMAASVVSGCASDETAEPPVTEGSAPPVDPGSAPTMPDDPKSLVELKCSMCHSLDRVWSEDYDRAEWVSTVDRMKRNGLVITDEEYATIVDYLAEQ